MEMRSYGPVGASEGELPALPSQVPMISRRGIIEPDEVLRVWNLLKQNVLHLRYAQSKGSF